MALKDTINQIKKMLEEISHDLEKGAGGNKAAAQRVRVNTIKLEKLAKVYRKESVASEKKGNGKAKPAVQKSSTKKTVAKTTKKKKK